MAKWRDVKHNKVQIKKSIKTNAKSPKSDLASLSSRLKAFFTDTFLITTPILYIVIYLVMGSGEDFAFEMYSPDNCPMCKEGSIAYKPGSRGN